MLRKIGRLVLVGVLFLTGLALGAAAFGYITAPKVKQRAEEYRKIAKNGSAGPGPGGSYDADAGPLPPRDEMEFRGPSNPARGTERWYEMHLKDAMEDSDAPLAEVARDVARNHTKADYETALSIAEQMTGRDDD